MSTIEEVVQKAVKKQGKDPTGMLEIIRDVQAELGHVPDKAKSLIAAGMGLSKADLDGIVSFYHFFSEKPVGKYAVYRNNSAVAVMKGREAVARAFEQEAGCKFGQTTPDGIIGLHDTSDIGMNDQEPAAIINGVVFTGLTPEKVKDIVSQMRSGKDVTEMVKEYGDGLNGSEIV